MSEFRSLCLAAWNSRRDLAPPLNVRLQVAVKSHWQIVPVPIPIDPGLRVTNPFADLAVRQLALWLVDSCCQSASSHHAVFQQVRHRFEQ